MTDFDSFLNIEKNDFMQKQFEHGSSDFVSFWEKEALKLSWFKPWHTALIWQAPSARWFEGGKINACYNALDVHIQNKKGSKNALIWEGEPGDTRHISYQELYDEVNNLSYVLKNLGIKKGDRVAIYMPMIPEAVMAMLACARIGAIHSVVFAGFSSEALKDRINDSTAKLLITADGGFRKGKIVPLKDMADQALLDAPSIEHVLVFERTKQPVSMKNGRDLYYHSIKPVHNQYINPEPMEAEDPLFILYTSGTTGKPKGIVHSTGGYLVGARSTMDSVFAIKDSDVFWCTADIGWITGHTYLTYGPLLACSSCIIYEGVPDFPEKNRFWQIIDKYKVTIFYTAPTAIRSFMKWGFSWLTPFNLDSLRLLGSVGEPINPEAWQWYYKNVGLSKCPIVDTWWQTETGSIMMSPVPGYSKLKPGSPTGPLPGIKASILDEEGLPAQQGYLTIENPWPSMLRGIYNDQERFQKTYFSKFCNRFYVTGDGASIDNDGFYTISGRVDDVINVSGHRLGTMEIESAFVEHPNVAEAAAIGINHEIKGQAIAAFITLKEGCQGTHELEKILKAHIDKKIGPIARPESITFVEELPKTRSGKIMRRLLRDIAEGRSLGDTTSLSDQGVLKYAKDSYRVTS